MGESTARDGRWERGEQRGCDRLDAVRPSVVVAYCNTWWLPKVCQWCVLTEYVTVYKGRLEKNEQCVKTETRDRECEAGRKRRQTSA